MRDVARTTTLYFGGAGDRRSSIVHGYHKACQPDVRCQRIYIQHSESQRALSLSRRAASSGSRLVLVGHSWGADTAARVARTLDGRVDLLVGVDPVAKPFSRVLKRTERAPMVQRVITVDGGPVRRSRGDQIKEIGARIGGGMPRVFDNPDILIHADHRHDDFELMFNARGDDGRSAADWVAAVETGEAYG